MKPPADPREELQHRSERVDFSAKPHPAFCSLCPSASDCSSLSQRLQLFISDDSDTSIVRRSAPLPLNSVEIITQSHDEYKAFLPFGCVA